MGLLDAPANDFKGAPLASLDPLRDLPNVLGNWDASLLQGDVGDGVDALPDISGYAQSLVRYSTAAKTLTIAQRNGRKVIRTNGTGNFLTCAGWGQRWGGINTPSPFTILAVVSATAGSGSNPRTIVGTGFPAAGTLSAATTAGTSTITTSVSYPVGTEVIVDTSANREIVTVAAVAGASAPFTITTVAPTTISHASGVAVTPNQFRYALDGVGQAPVVSMPLPSAIVGPSGAPMNDDALHVHAVTVEPHQVQAFVDGLHTAGTAYGTPSAAGIVDLYFGTAGPGSLGLDGDLAQLIVCRGALTPAQVHAASSALAAKWGITIPGRCDLGAFTARLDATTPNGQIARILPCPPNLRKASGNPLIIWSHPHGATQGIAPGYFSWPLLFALNNLGCTVAASALHGNNWGNQNAIDDNVDLYTRIGQYFGTPSAVIMVGGSMGGLASALAVADGRIPNIKGVIGIDAVFNLANLFANNAGTYSAAIRTAHGIAADGSDYAAKTAGKDPILLPASSYAGVRWRFYASTSDTDVPKANNADAFASYLGSGVPEKAVLTHVMGHLAPQASWPADVLAFVKRCLA